MVVNSIRKLESQSGNVIVLFLFCRSLKEHKVETHGLMQRKKYKCEVCQETMPNETLYNEHLREHPLECRLCGKYFYRSQNLDLHYKRHLGIKPYKCDLCSKSFLTKQKHDEHKYMHTGKFHLSVVNLPRLI